MNLHVEKHIKYFQLCMASLPAKAQSEDANKLALVYFVLQGLSLLGALDLSQSDRHNIIDQILSHQIPDKSMTAFRASTTFALSSTSYDLPNLSATFFALANLLVLEHDVSVSLDRHKIMKFVSQSQVKTGALKGSFMPVLDSHGDPFGESDLRLCYIAAGIRKMLGYDRLLESQRIHDIDQKALIDFIVDKVTYSGGLSSYKDTEAHSGLTFCGLAALKLLDFDFSAAPWASSTVNWLVHRQVSYPENLYGNLDYDYHDEEDTGGFNGRENKFADTCYSWWVVASLKLIDPPNVGLIDAKSLTEYLLKNTQHALIGGFGKDTDAFPDPFHTFLALASLSLLKNIIPDDVTRISRLQDMDEALVITEKSRRFLDHIWRADRQ